jgi:hypothetical protein
MTFHAAQVFAFREDLRGVELRVPGIGGSFYLRPESAVWLTANAIPAIGIVRTLLPLGQARSHLRHDLRTTNIRAQALVLARRLLRSRRSAAAYQADVSTKTLMHACDADDRVHASRR